MPDVVGPANGELRKCLKCQGDFSSTGPGNRICRRCTYINNQQCASRRPPPASNYDRREVEEESP